VSVAVHDRKTDEAFELAVREDERAHDVFLHPFAYAASRRALSVGSGPVADVAGGVGAAL
jgi:hypothetical protein